MTHPDELENKLTRRQLSEWLAWNNISPIGERRADTRMAVMVSHLRGAWVENDVEPEKFMPQFPIYDDSEAWGPETEAQLKLKHARELDQFR